MPPFLPVYVQRLIDSSTPSSSSTSVSQVDTVKESETEAELEPEEGTVILTEKENKEIERLEQNRTLLAAGLGKDASGEDVENLQRMLWELGYYQGQITGMYDEETMEAVFQFQVEHGVLSSELDVGAGYFGKKTLAALLLALENKIEIISGYPKEVQAWVPAKKVLPEIAQLKVPEVAIERQSLNFSSDLVNKKIVQEVGLAAELDLGDRGDEVIKLLNFLISQGYLAEGLNTGYFGAQTQAALIQFQMVQGIVENAETPGAGRVGPTTLAAINSF